MEKSHIQTLNKIYDLTKEKSVIAFDFWNTLAHRKCRNDKIIILWAKSMNLFLSNCVSAKQLLKIRKDAEIQCKKRYRLEEGTYEQLLKIIYSTVKPSVAWNLFFEYSKRIELELEKKNIVVDETAWKLMEKLQKEQKKVVIISDFYFGKDMIWDLLHHLGYQFDLEDLFISSDCGYRKDTGNLYHYVLKKLSIKEKEMLMIGDSYESDYNIPNSLGIKAFWKKHEIVKEEYYNKKRIKQHIKRVTKNNVKSLDGYVNLLLLSVDKLYSQLIRDGVKNIFFCSREGQVLKYIFDKYQEELPEIMKINTHYLYVSRKATLLAALEEIDKEKFKTIFAGGKEYTISEFLIFLGFDWEVIANVLEERNVKKDAIIGKGCIHENLWHHLTKNNSFRQKYDEIRSEQKSLFSSYLNGFGINFKEEGLPIVDVGWRGSIQDNIRNFMPDSVKIVGYYLGIYDVEKGVEKCIITPGSDKKGIMFSTTPQISGDYYICRKNRMFWEILFSADHGPVIGYKKDRDGEVCPIIDPDDEYRKVYDKIKPYLKHLLSQYDEILRLYHKSIYMIRDFYKLHLSMYAWQLFINLPMGQQLYKDLQNLVVDNFVKDTNKVFSIKKNFLRRNRERIKYYFNYNRNYLNLFFQKEKGIMYKVGEVYCFLLWSAVVLFRVILKGRRL